VDRSALAVVVPIVMVVAGRTCTRPNAVASTWRAGHRKQNDAPWQLVSVPLGYRCRLQRPCRNASGRRRKFVAKFVTNSPILRLLQRTQKTSEARTDRQKGCDPAISR
jgi:hypothetical protein